MTEPRVHDDQPADPVDAPESSTGAATGADEQIPTGGNAAQAAAVFGAHSEPPAEMDSGGAG